MQFILQDGNSLSSYGRGNDKAIIGQRSIPRRTPERLAGNVGRASGWANSEVGDILRRTRPDLEAHIGLSRVGYLPHNLPSKLRE